MFLKDRFEPDLDSFRWLINKNEDDRQKFSEAFEPFAAKQRRAVWDQVLKTRREVEGSNWPPSWIEGMASQGEVARIGLRQNANL